MSLNRRLPTGGQMRLQCLLGTLDIIRWKGFKTDILLRVRKSQHTKAASTLLHEEGVLNQRCSSPEVLRPEEDLFGSRRCLSMLSRAPVLCCELLVVCRTSSFWAIENHKLLWWGNLWGSSEPSALSPAKHFVRFASCDVGISSGNCGSKSLRVARFCYLWFHTIIHCVFL